MTTVLPDTWRFHPCSTHEVTNHTAAARVKPWKVLQAPGLKPLADCQLCDFHLLLCHRSCSLVLEDVVWVHPGSSGNMGRVRSRISSSKAEAEPLGAENSHTDSLEFATALPSGGRGGSWPAVRSPLPLQLPHLIYARLMLCHVTVILEFIGDLWVGTQLGASREVMCIMCWGSFILPQPQRCVSWLDLFLTKF